MLTPSRYRFVFTVLDPFTPPDYLGSTWRGALGHALRRVLCVMPPYTACRECPLRQPCLYPLFYDQPLLSAQHSPEQMQDPPRPFVLEPELAPESLQPGDQLGLGLVLFGETVAWLPNLVGAMLQLAQRGLGSPPARVSLQQVWQQDSVEMTRWHSIFTDGQLQPHRVEPLVIPPLPSQVRLELLTPLRLRRKGHYLKPDTFVLNDLLQPLYRRLILLNNLYGDSTRQQHYAPLPLLTVTAEQSLRWMLWQRFSSRQKRSIDMDGLVGHLLLEGQGLEAVWRYLWLGQWFHVGSGTSLGLGQYQLIIKA